MNLPDRRVRSPRRGERRSGPGRSADRSSRGVLATLRRHGGGQRAALQGRHGRPGGDRGHGGDERAGSRASGPRRPDRRVPGHCFGGSSTLRLGFSRGHRGERPPAPVDLLESASDRRGGHRPHPREQLLRAAGPGHLPRSPLGGQRRPGHRGIHPRRPPVHLLRTLPVAPPHAHPAGDQQPRRQAHRSLHHDGLAADRPVRLPADLEGPRAGPVDQSAWAGWRLSPTAS